jgi:hypothetical protein
MARKPRKAYDLADVPEDGWVALKSSNVIGANWRGDGVLWIRFNASFYVYSGVPESVYRGLIEASSHGKYHAANIKNKYVFSGPIAAR